VGYAACHVNSPARTKIEISNGLRGISVGFRNACNTTTKNVKWNIDVNGEIFNTINTTLQGTIESIEPGMVAYEKISLFGFRPVSISVIAVPKNVGKVAKHIYGFLY
jgi:hypothetical protein